MTFRDRLVAFLDRATTRNAITAVIVLNAVTLGWRPSIRPWLPRAL